MKKMRVIPDTTMVKDEIKLRQMVHGTFNGEPCENPDHCPAACSCVKEKPLGLDTAVVWQLANTLEVLSDEALFECYNGLIKEIRKNTTQAKLEKLHKSFDARAVLGILENYEWELNDLLKEFTDAYHKFITLRLILAYHRMSYKVPYRICEKYEYLCGDAVDTVSDAIDDFKEIMIHWNHIKLQDEEREEGENG